MKALCLCLLFCALASADDVRLTNGDRTGNGRLEVNLDGRWGLVCGDNFDMRDAHVVCKQLGYSEEATINTANRIDDDNTPFLMGNVRCTGVEDDLFDCSYDPIMACDSKHVAVITCGETPVEVTGSLGQTAGIIAAIAMCFVALIGITILLVGCVWRNQLFGINCCGVQNTAV